MAEMKNANGIASSGMPPHGKAKRGMLFTVASMLLGISLLSFAFFLSQQSASSARTVAWLADVDRAIDTYSSIEDSLARVISPSINISVRNSTVYINESLPLGAQMQADLDRFAQFEAERSELNVSMNLTNLKAGSFVIRPAEALVGNSPGFFNITPVNSPESSGTVVGYDVEIIFPPGGVDSIAWLALSNSSGDTVAAHVRARDMGYATVMDAFVALDRDGTSVLNVTKEGATVALVRFSSPAALSVQHSGNVGLKTSIAFTNPAHVEADDSIGVQSFANRTGRVRIA